MRGREGEKYRGKEGEREVEKEGIEKRGKEGRNEQKGGEKEVKKGKKEGRRDGEGWGEVCTRVLSGSPHCGMGHSTQAQLPALMPPCCFFAAVRLHQAPHHPREPVQAVSGAADENPDQLPALLHPLHQAQRVQEAAGT